ncbi:hypothetical protein Hanom_Chr05g00427671 [Helianthus anomalus]
MVNHASCGSVESLIAERHEGTCTNRSLSRFLCALGPRLDTKLQSSRGSHWKQPLYSYGAAVYILPSSNPTVSLLLVGFTEYDDDDDGGGGGESVYFHLLDKLKSICSIFGY